MRRGTPAKPRDRCAAQWLRAGAGGQLVRRPLVGRPCDTSGLARGAARNAATTRGGMIKAATGGAPRCRHRRGAWVPHSSSLLALAKGRAGQQGSEASNKPKAARGADSHGAGGWAPRDGARVVRVAVPELARTPSDAAPRFRCAMWRGWDAAHRAPGQKPSRRRPHLAGPQNVLRVRRGHERVHGAEGGERDECAGLREEHRAWGRRGGRGQG